MALKIGDKVKLLNEAGGGYVTKIISSSMVEVSVEDGFNIPYATRDLLKVEDQGTASQFFDEDFGKQPEIVDDPMDDPRHLSTELFRRQSLDLKKGIYLTFVPQDQRWLMTGLIDVYIVNHSEFDILFSLYLLQDSQFSNKEYDVVGPHNKFLIDTIDREDINDWLKGQLQVIFIKERLDNVIAPLNKSFQIKGSKFYQEANFKHIDLLDSNALVVELITIDYQQMISKNNDEFKDLKIEESPKAKIKQQKSLIQKYKIAPLEAEVDLHISALSDDFKHMKPHEILSEQMDHFNKTIEDAMLHQFKKVIYIHGIGNGSLKKKLKDELRGYEEIEVRDASFQQYGYGAIEVHIHYK